MKIAKGKYILVVNSDDKLTKKALSILNKYDLKYPKIDFFKEIDENFLSKGNLSLNSNFFQKIYDTNSKETVLINDLIFNSELELMSFAIEKYNTVEPKKQPKNRYWQMQS